jgi:radical SAM protein with 4Fe4S-binding SPASM domain
MMSSVRLAVEKEPFDPLEHYKLDVGPTHEFAQLSETPACIRNIGWTLGNDCPYRCTHCYSMSARQKGKNMSRADVNRIVSQLALNGIETVNLGGNEPLFTNGPNPKDTLLPQIIQELTAAGIEVGLTTSGITLLHLYRDQRWAFDLLNDVDVSFDSPFEEQHNKNRGARLFHQAIEALRLCRDAGKPHTVIMAGMIWNFTPAHLTALVALAAEYRANVRINPVKPVEPQHMSIALSPAMYYAGFRLLMELCDPVDLGEPPIAAVTDYEHARRCPCGRTSFRIHSITPDGHVYVSPCVYLHDYKSSYDLLEHDLADIVASPQFRVFRQRNANPELVEGCRGCRLLARCGGGCVARSYLHHMHTERKRTMLARDPYCPIRAQAEDGYPKRPKLDTREKLVHMDYLCTWIGRPRVRSQYEAKCIVAGAPNAQE